MPLTGGEKMDRNLLFRIAENQRLEMHEEKPWDNCSVCGKDIFRWEMINGNAVFDGSFYCNECLQERC